MQPGIHDFIERVDERLATISDDGDQAVFLQHCLTRLERNFATLVQWAMRDDGTPNPLGDEVDAMLITEIIIEIEARLDNVRARARARIRAAEAAMGAPA